MAPWARSTAETRSCEAIVQLAALPAPPEWTSAGSAWSPTDGADRGLALLAALPANGWRSRAWRRPGRRYLVIDRCTRASRGAPTAASSCAGPANPAVFGRRPVAEMAGGRDNGTGNRPARLAFRRPPRRLPYALYSVRELQLRIYHRLGPSAPAARRTRHRPQRLPGGACSGRPTNAWVRRRGSSRARFPNTSERSSRLPAGARGRAHVRRLERMSKPDRHADPNRSTTMTVDASVGHDGAFREGSTFLQSHAAARAPGFGRLRAASEDFDCHPARVHAAVARRPRRRRHAQALRSRPLRARRRPVQRRRPASTKTFRAFLAPDILDSGSTAQRAAVDRPLRGSGRHRSSTGRRRTLLGHARQRQLPDRDLPATLTAFDAQEGADRDVCSASRLSDW